MTRRLLLFGAVALLTLLVACGSSATATPTSTATPTAAAMLYGGPYYINSGEKVKKVPFFEKLTNFDRLSITNELTKTLLEESIDWHRSKSEDDSGQVNSPYGDKQQLYNYVITTGDVIIVATWVQEDKVPVEIERVADACEAFVEPNTNQSSNTVYDNSQALIKLRTTGRLMVNFYPEERRHGVPGVFLCERDKSERDQKILDGLTKHFMLAQGLQANGGEVNSRTYKENWADTGVGFAGEIIVDLINCIYAVTDGSGTYMKDKDYDIGQLEKVAKRFGEIENLNIPAYILEVSRRANDNWQFVDGEEGKLDPELCKPN